jgi:hypothetical protein
MSVYDWLKENPQERYDIIKNNWLKLMTDKNTPYAVKEELKELVKNNIVINDAVLFFHKHLKMREFLSKKKYYDQEIKYVQNKIYNSRFLYKVYIYYLNTLYDKYRRKIIDFLVELIYCKHSSIFDFPIENIESYLISDDKALENFLICGKIFDRYLSNPLVRKLVKYCSLNLIKEIFTNGIKIGEIATLLDDTPVGVLNANAPLTSINAIKKMHDDHAKKYREKQLELIREDNKCITYMCQLIDIAKANNFYLPESKLDFVERGMLHNNCVAQYYEKQIVDIDTASEVTRLFFKKECTLELRIKVRHNKIVSTNLHQYKGRYNKDINIDNDCTNLQIDLTGKSSDILKIVTLTNKKEEVVK